MKNYLIIFAIVIGFGCEGNKKNVVVVEEKAQSRGAVKEVVKPEVNNVITAEEQAADKSDSSMDSSPSPIPAADPRGIEVVKEFHYIPGGAPSSACIAFSTNTTSMSYQAGPCPRNFEIMGETVKILKFCPPTVSGNRQQQVMVYEKILGDDGKLAVVSEVQVARLCTNFN